MSAHEYRIHFKAHAYFSQIILFLYETFLHLFNLDRLKQANSVHKLTWDFTLCI